MGRDGFQHIGQVIRQRYPARQEANQTLERRQRMLNESIVLACIIVLVATPAAIYLLANDKFLYGLAALIVALGAAFGPKVYLDSIQPNRRQVPATSDD